MRKDKRRKDRGEQNTENRSRAPFVFWGFFCSSQSSQHKTSLAFLKTLNEVDKKLMFKPGSFPCFCQLPRKGQKPAFIYLEARLNLKGVKGNISHNTQAGDALGFFSGGRTSLDW